MDGAKIRISVRKSSQIDSARGLSLPNLVANCVRVYALERLNPGAFDLRDVRISTVG